MRHRLSCLLLLAAFMGCHNDGPTAPAQQASLTGTWTATVAFDDIACGAPQSSTAIVNQYPNALIIYVSTKCYGRLSFTGNGTGNRVSGKILLKCGTANDPYSAPPSVEASGSGTLDGHHISLEIVAASNGACAFPGATIELTR